MAPIHHEHLAVARVWSEALLRLAAERGEEDGLLAELQDLVRLLERQPDFELLLTSPVASDDVKRLLLERILRGKASDLLVDALQVLRQKGRLVILRALTETYRQAWLERRGRIEVRVASAAPLSEAERAALERAVNRRTGKTAELAATVDPELLGGMVVRIGDQRFDSSLRAALGRMEGALMERASRELMSGRSLTNN